LLPPPAGARLAGRPTARVAPTVHRGVLAAAAVGTSLVRPPRAARAGRDRPAASDPAGRVDGAGPAALEGQRAPPRRGSDPARRGHHPVHRPAVRRVSTPPHAP